MAFQLQNGPQFHRMYQNITLGPPATLHWDMRYRNRAGSFNPVSQYPAVRIRSLSDNILQTLFETTSAQPQQIPMTHFAANLAAEKMARLEREIERLKQENERLRRALEKALRAAK